ncbi:single-stranded DNA-binding protein [Corynebacterium guangdongense]|uniref:Single-stranded DNA-binding protein n=1 Tax=Corynebacterium guangdongense TaxID=1783348 RepID=A0ABU2A023_9CORY|nr:single-stranded DNA-binding protein [Corynebacterium guangdongense]MDR7330524.1 single-strand DNA-binding protein [Corynebacterium guangdongense]WJZ19079.1 Single-stranded DNA-binding protein [Corynebacterium guangdongense]
MAAGDTPITIVGNVVADPELRFTPSGAAVANFRVASTPRVYNRDSGQYEDGEALFLTCNVWRQAAENVAETLSKGMRVIVNGRLKQRSYQTREGEQRTVFEVEVDEVGPSLKFASAQVNRNPREGGSGGGNWSGGGNQGGGGQGGGNFGGGAGGNTGGNWGGNQGGFGGGNSGGGGNFGGQQSNQGGNAPQNDPWNSAPPAGGFGGGADDEPPF